MSTLNTTLLTSTDATTTINLTDAVEQTFDEKIPKPLLADYIEMSYLIIVLIIGVPMNLHVLFKLLIQKRKSATYSVKRCFLLLKINLNVSDTLILFVNAGGKLAWLISYEWRAGEAMCRLFKFTSISTLYLSSNIVVCIAVDRLKTVLTAKTLRRDHNVITTKIILCIAWTLALVCSIPQIFVFRTFNVLENTSADTAWYQCTDIWTIEKYLVQQSIHNASDTVTFETLHELSHLFIVFYGPLIVMAVAYFIIAVKLTQYSNGSLPSSAVQRRPPDATTVATAMLNKKYSTLSTQPSMSALSEVSEYAPVPADFATDMGYQAEVGSPPVRRSHRLITAFKNEFNYCFCVNSESNGHNCNQKAPAAAYRPTPRISIDGASFSSMPTPRKHTTTSVDRKRFFSVDAMTKNRCKKKNNSTPNGFNGRQFELNSTPRQPGWRRQLRSRVFRTTLLVVVAHVVFWTPYNFISLLRFVSEDLFVHLQDHINICEDMQFLIALVNPFLYGFGKSPSPY